MTKQTLTPDWEWADELLNNSDFSDLFEVEDCDFDSQTGNHNYFNETGNMVTVDIDGNVLLSYPS